MSRNRKKLRNLRAKSLKRKAENTKKGLGITIPLERTFCGARIIKENHNQLWLWD